MPHQDRPDESIAPLQQETQERLHADRHIGSRQRALPAPVAQPYRLSHQ